MKSENGHLFLINTYILYLTYKQTVNLLSSIWTEQSPLLLKFMVDEYVFSFIRKVAMSKVELFADLSCFFPSGQNNCNMGFTITLANLLKCLNK